jgi:hypothetical protein
MIAILTCSQHFKAPVSLPLVHRRTTNWKLLWISLFYAHRGVLLFFSTEWRWSFFYHSPCSAATNWGHFNGLSWTMAKSGIARRWFTLSRVIVVVEQNSQWGCWLMPGSCVRCRPEEWQYWGLAWYTVISSESLACILMQIKAASSWYFPLHHLMSFWYSILLNFRSWQRRLC